MMNAPPCAIDPTGAARLLAFVIGMVHQELLLLNEYLIGEYRFRWGHLPIRLRLADQERPPGVLAQYSRCVPSFDANGCELSQVYARDNSLDYKA
jgi:hypothetical protein